MLVEAKIPVYLVPNPAKGIKRDCPMELLRKDRERRVLCMRIMADMQAGITDDEIIKKYSI